MIGTNVRCTLTNRTCRLFVPEFGGHGVVVGVVALHSGGQKFTKIFKKMGARLRELASYSYGL